MKFFELKLRLIAPVVAIFLFICLGSPAPASATDQCSAPSVGAGTGVVGRANNPSVGTCGAVITVFTVDANGAATSFTVTLKGNGNPYDGVEDTLVGVQNNSSSLLKSMSLSSPTAAIFGFDGDGPCNPFFHTPAYSWCPGATGYEGPDNTFSITNTSSGTVKFTTPIPAGESTWFALEGTPASLTTVTQTATLGPPGTTTTLTFNTDTYKITGVNNTGGEVVTVTAFLVPTSAFPALPGFPGETIIPYADYTAAAGGVNTGVEFQVHCQRSATDTTPCNIFYVLKTGFKLPPSLSGGIGGVDFLVAHGVDCPLNSTSNVQSIFLAYLATVTDPTDVASSDGPSCEVPTYTVGAPPITTGTASRLTAWGPPVDNGALNQVEAGATQPLTFMLRDILGNPVTNLSLCDSFTFTPSLGNVCNDIPAVPKPWVNITSFGIVCPNGAPINPLTGGTIDSPGNSALNNNGFGNYEIGWKTQKDWQGSCANVVFTLDSGLKEVPASIGFQFQ